MIAKSRSGRSQPTVRPELAALGPETLAVQSWLLSSIHWPAAFFLTMRPTGLVGRLAAAMGGEKAAPELGGGLTPPYGPLASLTTSGGKAKRVPMAAPPPPRIVEALPDSKIAA